MLSCSSASTCSLFNLWCFFLNRFILLHIPELLETDTKGEHTKGATDDSADHRDNLLSVRVLLELDVHATELHVIHHLLRLTDDDEFANRIEALHEERKASADEDEVEFLFVAHVTCRPRS